jgi:DNA-binding transcriptional ArsR family regulator
MLTTLTAIAEPHRLKIVELLRHKPHSVNEIVSKLRLAQPQVSKHLHVLVEAKLVDVHPAAQQRIYELRPEPFQELDEWVESYRHLWDQRFDRLDGYLAKLQQKKKEEKKKQHDKKRR